MRREDLQNQTLLVVVFNDDVVFSPSFVVLKGIRRLRSDADVENEFSDGSLPSRKV